MPTVAARPSSCTLELGKVERACNKKSKGGRSRDGSSGVGSFHFLEDNTTTDWRASD